MSFSANRVFLTLSGRGRRRGRFSEKALAADEEVFRGKTGWRHAAAALTTGLGLLRQGHKKRKAAATVVVAAFLG